MPTRSRFIALSAVALLLAACSKDPVDPPMPAAVSSPPANVGMASPAPSPSSDPSLPSATSVFGSAQAAASAPATIEPGVTPTEAQEKTALPLPGQAGSHSAPKVSDGTASAPS